MDTCGCYAWLGFGIELFLDGFAMSLERLRISDFQCHESLGIAFDPKVTCLIGPSDVGKSAVLRAIRWVAFNRPLGDACVREGTERSTVKLLVDGQTIRRKRGKGINSYELDKQKYEAFGNSVPESIGNLLNLSDANVQGQHDPSFWFSLSPPEVARQLNQVVDLDVMDAVVVRVASRVRAVGMERDVVTKRLREAQGELEGLSYVPEVEKVIEKLEALEESCITDESGLLALSDMIEEIEKAKAGVVDVPDIGELKELVDGLESVEAECYSLRYSVSEIVNMRNGLECVGENLVEAVEGMKEEIGDMCPLCGNKIERGLL